MLVCPHIFLTTHTLDNTYPELYVRQTDRHKNWHRDKLELLLQLEIEGSPMSLHKVIHHFGLFLDLLSVDKVT